MKPNQWCKISTLTSQHRKPIIPGATATGPMTDAITKLKLPPSCLLQITFRPQSQHGYRPSTNYLWARRANTGTGQVIPSLGHQEQPKNQN